MTPYHKQFGQWVSVNDSLPDSDGKYMCKIDRLGEEFEAMRLLKSNHWFGGCRPFSDNDKVKSWYRHQVFNIFQQEADTAQSEFEFALQLGLCIEALTEKEVCAELFIDVISDRNVLAKMLKQETPAAVISMANRFLDMDSDRYSIVLSAPMAALSQHVRSCATA